MSFWIILVPFIMKFYTMLKDKKKTIRIVLQQYTVYNHNYVQVLVI